ncbi:YndJ family protein [Psychrobacillus sp. INOP01]|uniref:YndJ family protein n=1 Tax=Psychrobacillus sp. INOP01 TaxID=2829187 RepID=UPI001BAB5FE9|nr:YndJ family protein [Psychrobacillus sp. INOP01]QUG42040.1 YndJ family protein [Psychrobacillus sp. INOP01]
MTYKWLTIIHIVLFAITAFFTVNPWYFLMLSIAHILFVPLTLQLILKVELRMYYFVLPAVFSVIALQITEKTSFDIVLAFIYLLFTLAVAIYGFARFAQRGFAHLEEFSIDAGLMYLFMGGIWFFAFETGIDTGFSPMLTWLTAIHFHYSSFLLPIFIGFVGRLYKPKSYPVFASIILVSPLVVAAGITFSPWLELVSVLLYIIGIYGFIVISFKVPFKGLLQKSLVLISFSALGITIIFSLLYAVGNAFGVFQVSIEFMLKFHGFLNCLLFGLCGVIGWSILTPVSTYRKWNFPISLIRGKFVIGEQILEPNKGKETYNGLVDNMEVYVNKKNVKPAIVDFYENTKQYQLFSEVQWYTWFKPLAAVYRMISQRMQQLNLPYSSKKVEMTGDIIAVKDGRLKTRAWLRKIESDVIFVALYSLHQKDKKTYMNIALPLPSSSMIGILELQEKNNGDLQLTSRANSNSDAGIYLSFRKFVFKLPLQEHFLIEELPGGELYAKHRMKIFSIPFLSIDYTIVKKIGKTIGS